MKAIDLGTVGAYHEDQYQCRHWRKFWKIPDGNDEELMRLIGSANIACRMRAADPTIMAQTVELALRENVSISAHPGFNDIWEFGRRQIKMNSKDLEYSVTYQIGALQAIASSKGSVIIF